MELLLRIDAGAPADERARMTMLTYQGYVVGYLTFARAFEPADNDDVYLNAAVLKAMAA
jgi:hypothetical protein